MKCPLHQANCQRLLLLPLVAILMSSCSNLETHAEPAGEKVLPASFSLRKWPHHAFAEVRAYVFDPAQDTAPGFFVDDSMASGPATQFSFAANATPESEQDPWFAERHRVTKGVINPQGAKLSATQAARLLKAASIPHPTEHRTDCYFPHHIFVFYDRHHVVAGFLEICLSCKNFRAEPLQMDGALDWSVLEDLLRELKVPVDSDYTELYQQSARTLGRR